MGQSPSILIVDDEKNIRLTLRRSIESMGFIAETAITGEEALEKVKSQHFNLILLDIKLPGIDGIEVLREIHRTRPDVAVIIITAHGTIESAVEAMKLGSIDFLQKPFTPDEIRNLVTNVLNRQTLDETTAVDYESHLELAKKCINNRYFDAAVAHLKDAVHLDPSNPEAFNLLGLLAEIQGDILTAQKNYRAALALDPAYKPAKINLDRSTTFDEKRIIQDQ
ncbi:MAG: response regulator [Candidatus Marinimicrobia bacterium]|nr:response regulator [Candidatus Neomarinimicrobiota bacterium]